MSCTTENPQANPACDEKRLPVAWTDTITVLRARRARLAKLIRTDGTIEAYENAYRYDADVFALTGLDDLHALLKDLVYQPDRCVIRAAPLGGTHGIRRLLHRDGDDEPTLADVPRRWIGLDVDGVELPADVPVYDLLACATIAVERLPRPFWRAACLVQATASHAIKPGCRLRLWYWANRPMTGEECKTWLRDSPVDLSIFAASQPIYTAAPIFEDARPDHIPDRLAEMPGEEWLSCPLPGQPTPRRDVMQQPVRIIHPQWLDREPGQSKEHAARILSKQIENVMRARPGQRHNVLRDAALTIGGILDVLCIDQTRAAEALLRAVSCENAQDRQNATETVAWGLAEGRSAPLSLECAA